MKKNSLIRWEGSDWCVELDEEGKVVDIGHILDVHERIVERSHNVTFHGDYRDAIGEYRGGWVPLGTDLSHLL